MNPLRKRAGPPAYYNEFEPFAAEWLRNLVRAGSIAPGCVDTRSIEDLGDEDAERLARRPQAHFFAGIGAWSHALRLAGWPDDRPVWTGSCPCQPFSSAGKGKGFADERHLWPAWFRLIDAIRPPVVFGEQVAGRAGYEWLDAVFTDLEGAGYAVGAAVLPAASVGAPHGRHRIFYGAVRLADAHKERFSDVRERNSEEKPRKQTPHGDDAHGRGAVVGPWGRVDWFPYRDGKSRPSEPESFPVAYGSSSGVGRLRAYGNAIVPRVAAAFIRSFVGALEDARV